MSMPMSRDGKTVRPRRSSILGAGPRHVLDKDERSIWKARVGYARHKGRVTALQAEAALAVLARLGPDGQCDPSHATLAQDAGCSRSTIIRALAALREVGLIDWERRIVRRADGTVEQTSNAYVLLVAPAWTCPPKPPKPEFQVETVTRSESFLTVPRLPDDVFWAEVNRIAALHDTA